MTAGRRIRGGILAAMSESIPPAPVQRTSRRPAAIAIYLLVCAAIAVISATLVYVGSGASDPALWIRGLKAFLIYWLVWGAVLPLIHRINRRNPPRLPSLLAGWPLHIALFCGVTVVTTASMGSSWRYYLYGDGAAFFHGMNVPVYLLLALGSVGWILYRASIDREREAAALSLRAAQLEAQLGQARLDTLRAQIHPHVLFNALNSIAALIRTDRADECYRMTELLASLLRSLLDESSKESVLLESEMEFVSRYLELESIRFRERLNWNIDVAEECRFVHVPPFVIQPMVENAIKHAVEATREPVNVGIRALIENSRLVIYVEDSGPGLLLGDDVHPGVGIRNVRERLALIYGADASVKFDSGEGGVRVEIDVPLEFPLEPVTVSA